MTINKLMVVGCGAMGSALIQGFLKAKVCQELTIICPHKKSAEPFLSMPHVTWHGVPSEVPEENIPEVIILAVKPQKLAEALTDYRLYIPSSLFVTVAASLPVAFYRRHLSEDARVIRVMPNLAVAFGEGMSIGFAEDSLVPAQQTLAHNLFASVGAMAWCDKETLLDVATLISGSGPAYFYLLVESLATVAVEQGLPSDIAYLLARQTAIGAGAILEAVDDSPASLRNKVTSPAGMTEAALKVLLSSEEGLKPLLQRALEKGVERARELARGLVEGAKK
jgi:pyrroline-5-carboxylate reductase